MHKRIKLNLAIWMLSIIGLHIITIGQVYINTNVLGKCCGASTCSNGWCYYMYGVHTKAPQQERSKEQLLANIQRQQGMSLDGDLL